MVRHCLRATAAVVSFLAASGFAPALHAQEPAPPQAAEPPAPAEHPAPAAGGGAPEAAPPQAEAPAPPAAQAPGPPAAAAPPPSGEGAAAEAAQPAERTPVRLSMTYGEVSFWRPGAEDWTRAEVNTPLAPGDALYSAPGATLELQIGPHAFARASGDTQVGLDSQEPDFLQLKVTAGHLSLDLRRLKAGQTIEVDTPNAAFTIDTNGYYRIDVNNQTTTLVTRRAGHATLTPAGGDTMAVASSEEVVIEGTDTARVATYVAPQLDAWDRWNYERTDHLIDAVSARYVNPNVYGVDELDHYGTWRVTPQYGTVWVPSGVPPDWAPYSAGRWIWDPLYGWSWVDNAPWGWAPCHYGRWVSFGGYWGWAPGPLVVTPVYAPALVAFFGGPHFGVSIGLGAPAVGWVALGWGEPLVPWWGRPGFIGTPWWGGWGGPRVVNNVVINRTTIVNVNNINVYENARVKNAVIATREDKFGRGLGERVRVGAIDSRQFEPVHGKLPMQPVAASLAPGVGRAARPPEAMLNRSVVATRAPQDSAARLRAAGLTVPERPASAAPRLATAPKNPHAGFSAPRPPFGQQSTVERPAPPPPPRFGESRAVARGAEASQSAPPAPHGMANSPSAHAAVSGQPPSHAHQAAPREAAPQQPRQPAQREPAPPRLPERRAAAPAPAGRNLPGEPANRLYHPQPPMPASHAAPAAPHHGGGSNASSAAHGGHNDHH